MSGIGAMFDDLGLVMETTTNIWHGASMSLVAKVGLPDGYVHVELADASGEFTVWCCNPDTYEFVKLVDSQDSPTMEIPMSAWRRFAVAHNDAVEAARLRAELTRILEEL